MSKWQGWVTITLLAFIAAMLRKYLPPIMMLLEVTP